MLIKVFSVLSMLLKLSKLPPGVCTLEGGATGLLNKGGGKNRLPGLVTEQQAVEFPQVLASRFNNIMCCIAMNVIPFKNISLLHKLNSSQVLERYGLL